MTWNPDRLLVLMTLLLPIPALIPILISNWRRYGLLAIMAAAIGNVLCILFVSFHFYSFPPIPFHFGARMPFFSLSLVIAALVLLGVRYSPASWAWKIPFYWVMVHLAMFAETLIVQYKLMAYRFKSDFWDSYTWWWIYFLMLEWIGCLLVPAQDRRPMPVEWLRYGKLGWLILHLVLIATIFLAGVYLGLHLSEDGFVDSG